MNTEKNTSRLIALGYEGGYGRREVNTWKELIYTSECGKTRRSKSERVLCATLRAWSLSFGQ